MLLTNILGIYYHSADEKGEWCTDINFQPQNTRNEEAFECYKKLSFLGSATEGQENGKRAFSMKTISVKMDLQNEEEGR